METQCDKRGLATYTAAVTYCYHTGVVVDSDDGNAETWHDEDTSIVSRRVVDVIDRRVQVTVGGSQRCLGSLGGTVKEGDGQT